MKKWLFVALSLLAPQLAMALDQASVPGKFPIPWGNSAGVAYIRAIPEASQIGVQNCAASLTDGFPPLTFVPAAAGGCPPFGQDMNGILRQLSQWSRWDAAGGAPLYDASFSASIGGYPSGATLANASTVGCFWISVADNNASNPDAGGANWNSSCPGGLVGAASGGTANAQTVTTMSFTLRAGIAIEFIAGFSNTGPLQVNANGIGLINVYRVSQLGTSMSVGGEVVAGQIVRLQYDGTRWQCTTCPVVLVGQIVDFSGTAAPNGWGFADGQCRTQSDANADLFTVTGTAYGSCSAGNFAYPDARGRSTSGRDNMTTAANRITSAGSGCVGTTLGLGCGNQARDIAVTNLPSTTFAIAAGFGVNIAALPIAALQGSHTHTGTGTPSGTTANIGTTTIGGTSGSGTTLHGAEQLVISTNTLPAMVTTATLSGGTTTAMTAASGGSGTDLITLNPILIVNKIVKL